MLGLPVDLFLREVAIAVAYATAAVLCARHWTRGGWAQIAALAAALGALLQAYQLAVWVSFANDVLVLRDLQTLAGVGEAVRWLQVLALAGVLAAVVMGRDGSSTRPVTGP